jgi:hypothetical protein
MAKRFISIAGISNELKLSIATSFPNKNLRITYPKCIWFIHRVLGQKIYNPKEYEDKGVEINTKFLPEILSVDHQTGCDLLKFMLKEKYLVRAQGHYYFKKNEKILGNCATYRLHLRFEKADYRICYEAFEADEHRFIDNMLQFERSREEESLEVRKTLEILTNNVTISPDGLKYIKEKYGTETPEHFKVEDTVLLSILNKQVYCSSKEYGRLFSSFCNLKRDQRSFVLMDGSPIYSIDMANAQILLAFIPIIKFFEDLQTPLPQDIEECLQQAEQGKFYGWIMEKLGLQFSQEGKEKFKEKLFKEVLFAQNLSYPTRLRKLLQENYSGFWKVLKVVKKQIKDKYNYTFAKHLQVLEAELFLGVFKELTDNNHQLLTLHDAIYSSSIKTLIEAEILIKKAMKEKYNLNVTVSRNYEENAVSVDDFVTELDLLKLLHGDDFIIPDYMMPLTEAQIQQKKQIERQVHEVLEATKNSGSFVTEEKAFEVFNKELLQYKLKARVDQITQGSFIKSLSQAIKKDDRIGKFKKKRLLSFLPEYKSNILKGNMPLR